MLRKTTLAFACLLPLQGHSESLQALVARCAPNAPYTTIGAIIAHESGGRTTAFALDKPHTLARLYGHAQGVIALQRQPVNSAELASWARYLLAHGWQVDIGLMQVSTTHLEAFSLTIEQLVEPCTNIRVGWAIFEALYRDASLRYGVGQVALLHAISAYNTGDYESGFMNGYVSGVQNDAPGSPSTRKSLHRQNIDELSTSKKKF